MKANALFRRMRLVAIVLVWAPLFATADPVLYSANNAALSSGARSDSISISGPLFNFAGTTSGTGFGFQPFQVGQLISGPPIGLSFDNRIIPSSPASGQITLNDRLQIGLFQGTAFAMSLGPAQPVPNGGTLSFAAQINGSFNVSVPGFDSPAAVISIDLPGTLTMAFSPMNLGGPPGSQVLLDSVSFTSSPVPEPSGLRLALAALVTVAGMSALRIQGTLRYRK